MRAKLVSGIVAAFHVVPVAVGAHEYPDAEEITAICYAEPTDPVCVEVLPEKPIEQPAEKPAEVEPTEVLAVTEALPRTGIETPGFLALATGLLAAGGFVLFGVRRRNSDSSAS